MTHCFECGGDVVAELGPGPMMRCGRHIIMLVGWRCTKCDKLRYMAASGGRRQ